jgi:hypothetical protein
MKSRKSHLHTHAIHTVRWGLTMLAMGTICLAACVPPKPPSAELTPLRECVRYEDLALGTTYQVPATFTDTGATMAVLPFQWSNQTWTSDGHADVRNDMPAPAPSNAMFLNNVNLGVDVASLECITLNFCDKGGNVNLIINDQVGNEQDLQTFGANLGNVAVAVDVDAENCGTLTLSGKFERFYFQERSWISFAVGGQELFIDNICPCE